MSLSPLRKYQAPPPAISSATTPRMIQLLRDMRPPARFAICARLAAPCNFLNGRSGYRLRAFKAGAPAIAFAPGPPAPPSGLPARDNGGWDRTAPAGRQASMVWGRAAGAKDCPG